MNNTSDIEALPTLIQDFVVERNWGYAVECIEVFDDFNFFGGLVHYSQLSSYMDFALENRYHFTDDDDIALNSAAYLLRLRKICHVDKAYPDIGKADSIVIFEEDRFDHIRQPILLLADKEMALRSHLGHLGFVGDALLSHDQYQSHLRIAKATTLQHPLRLFNEYRC